MKINKIMLFLMAFVVVCLPLVSAQETAEATPADSEKETGVTKALEQGKAPAKSSREEQLKKILERKGIKQEARKEVKSVQKATRASVKQTKKATQEKVKELKASGASKEEVKTVKDAGKKEVKNTKTAAKEKAKQIWTSAKERVKSLFGKKTQ